MMPRCLHNLTSSTARKESVHVNTPSIHSRRRGELIAPAVESPSQPPPVAITEVPKSVVSTNGTANGRAHVHWTLSRHKRISSSSAALQSTSLRSRHLRLTYVARRRRVA